MERIQAPVLPERLVGAKGLNVYHGSYCGFNSLRINVAELGMDINITELDETRAQQPQAPSNHPTKPSKRKFQAINKQNWDAATVPGGSSGKEGKDSGTGVWVPTGCLQRPPQDPGWGTDIGTLQRGNTQDGEDECRKCGALRSPKSKTRLGVPVI